MLLLASEVLCGPICTF